MSWEKLMSDETQDNVINERKLNQIKVSVLEAERRNLNTREMSNDAMVDLIKQTIIDYVEKTF